MGNGDTMRLAHHFTTYSTGQMLRISYFWPDWNCYARLGMFHTIFSTKRPHSYFPPNLRLKFLIIRFLTSVAYYFHNLQGESRLKLCILREADSDKRVATEIPQRMP